MPDQMSYQVTGLTPGAMLTFEVTTDSTGGIESAESNQASAAMPTGA